MEAIKPGSVMASLHVEFPINQGLQENKSIHHEGIYQSMPALLPGESNMAAVHTLAPSFLPNRQKYKVLADPQLHKTKPQPPLDIDEYVELEPDDIVRNIEHQTTPTHAPSRESDNLSSNDILPMDIKNQSNSATPISVPPLHQISGAIQPDPRPNMQELVRMYETFGKLLYPQGSMKLVTKPILEVTIPKRQSSEGEIHQSYNKIATMSHEPQSYSLPRMTEPSKPKPRMEQYENIYDEPVATTEARHPKVSIQPRMVKRPTPKPRTKQRSSSGIYAAVNLKFQLTV